MSINKDKYSKWESGIISKFYTSQSSKSKGKHHTLHHSSKTQHKRTKKNTTDMLDLLPTDNHPKQLHKNKIAIGIDFVTNDTEVENRDVLERKAFVNLKLNTAIETAIGLFF